tara:strand:- start:144 stop:647 length:504 start_codon:yes stop_codon:yes gene_type:complete
MALIKLNATRGLEGALPAVSGASLTGVSAGKILQIQHANSSTGVATSSTSYSDIVTVNITPSATSSTILIMCSVQMRKDSSAVGNQSAGLRILRDSTEIINHTNYGSWNDNNTNRTQESVQMNHIDSPSSTSAITFKLQGRAMVSGGQVSFNHDSSFSYITVMEIEG